MSRSLMRGVLAPFDYTTVEDILGVTLGEPKTIQSVVKQQLGVYAKTGEYLGDVMSDGRYFTYVELRDKVAKNIEEWLFRLTEGVSE